MGIKRAFKKLFGEDDSEWRGLDNGVGLPLPERSRPIDGDVNGATSGIPFTFDQRQPVVTPMQPARPELDLPQFGNIPASIPPPELAAAAAARGNELPLGMAKDPRWAGTAGGQVPPGSVLETAAPGTRVNITTGAVAPPMTTEDILRARADRDRALIHDPALKDDPDNKVPWWKRMLEGAFVGVQQANQAAQQATANNQSMTGLQALSIVGAGAGTGLAAEKQIADMRHQRDLQKAEGGLAGIEKDQAMQDARANREAARTAAVAKAARDQAEANKIAEELKNGKTPKGEPQEGPNGAMEWRMGPGTPNVPMIGADGKQLYKDDVAAVTGPDGVQELRYTKGPHRGEVVQGAGIPSRPQVDPVAKQTAEDLRKWEEESGKLQTIIDENDGMNKNAGEEFAQADAELKRMREDPNVLEAEITAQRNVVNGIKKDIREYKAKADAARARQKTLKKPTPTVAVGQSDDSKRAADRAGLRARGVPGTDAQLDQILDDARKKRTGQ